ncbi:peptide ABC transporter substrate-binding protein [Clostridium lundense]|uniref:peptide ABC transporter substrate-binding protein n=1 Tax=Clostridium lundense TaxID=319475 RepID=UPI0004836864|nr:peptide ABC transporter substrate-binding protein [Clostridium lundense]
MKKLISIFLVVIVLFSGCVEKKTSVNYINSRNYPIYGVTDLPEDLTLLNNLNIRYNDILVNLFEGLVKKDIEGKVIPGLAKSWSVNKDNTVYTFKIRDDANWSNGDKITARDFVDFFSQILSGNVNNIYDYQLFYIFGAEDYRKGKIDFNKTGIRSVDDEVLEIRLNVPCNYLLDILSSPIYGLRKLDNNLKTWVFNYDKIGFSGAYKIKHIKNEEIELEKNVYYWDKENVISDKIVILDNKNTESSLAAFQSSKVDFIVSPPLSEIKALRSKNFIMESSSHSGKVLTFNFSSDKVMNKELRNAINNCIDRKKICDDALDNTGEPWKYNISDNKKAKGDEKSNYSSFKILCLNDIKSKKVVEELKKELKTNLNIDLQIVFCENNEFIDKVKKNEYDMALMDFIMEYKNPISYYEKFLSHNYFNFFSYKNREYDNTIYKAKMEINETKQKELFKKADKILISDLPAIPLYIERNIICKNENIYDLEMNYNSNILLNKFYYSSK